MKTRNRILAFVPILVLLLGALVFQSCQKEPNPVVPPITYTVSIIKTDGGSVTADKTQGIAEGSTVNFRFTPDKDHSLYSIKVNGKSINAIIPFGSEYTYSYYGLNSNLTIEVVYVVTNLLVLSVQEPAWRLTHIGIYRVDDDSYSHSVILTPEQLGRKFYHQYPSMVLEIVNTDGTIGKDYWDLKDSVYTQWSQILTLVSLTPNKFVFKAKPIWSEWDNCYVYAVYTYERIP